MTLAELQARKALYLAAEAAILRSQAYRIQDGVIDRQVTRADLDFVTAELANIDRQIATLTPGARRILYLR